MEEAGFDFVADIPQEKLATEAKNSRHKREVCRYWLENRCMKADDCEFLHMFDHDKMPECMRGKLCTDASCKFKHTPDASKEECANYRLGFCPFGVKCRYRHDVLPSSSLPPISELWLSSYVAEERARKKAADSSIAFRVAMCDNYVRSGWCEFFDMCSYAHGEEQLKRKRGRPMPPPHQQQQQHGYVDAGYKRARMGEGHVAAPAGTGDDLTRLLAERASRVPGGVAASLPDNMPNCIYFTLRTLSAEPLALSLKRGEWLAPLRHRNTIESALRAGSNIFFYFSIIDSQHYQGVARATGGALTTSTDSIGAPALVIPITWLRACALPFSQTTALRNASAGLDYVARAADFQPVHVSVGKALMLLMYKSTEMAVDVSTIDGSAPFDTFDALENPEHAARLAAEDLGEEFRSDAPRPALPAPPVPVMDRGREREREREAPPDLAPARTRSGYQDATAAAALARAQESTSMLIMTDVAPGEPAEPWIADLLAGRVPRYLAGETPERIAADAFVRMQRGFLFACNNVTADVVRRVGIFGAADSMQAELERTVQPGTPVLLLNVHNRTLHGLFLARVPPVRELVPGLFPPMGSSRRTFPFHTQVMCVVDAPPLSNDEFAPLIGTMPNPGPLSAASVFAVAQLLFSRMPGPTVLRIAGMLRQMEKVGMPISGLLAVPEGIVTEAPAADAAVSNGGRGRA